ncbi:MAG: di-trans,poly-cis-decaprenylcistransferase [Spirochaetes bacterium GWF1_41_5]|nr:MAG: di-trans,poly-cis-decaprenylcistransferase [Spirochaetes bacterium GWF1_41_5]
MCSFPAYADKSIPGHVAIIMDGNGRWAEKHGVSVTGGHRAGLKALEKTSEFLKSAGVRIFTVYAFSTENWKRPAAEVNGLLQLLEIFFIGKINKIIRNKTRLRIIGDKFGFSPHISAILTQAEKRTAKFMDFTLQIALNYGSRDEIVRAVKKIADKASRQKISLRDINESLLSSHLDTKEFPDPDLLIRTGGDMRISNFLLYQMAYTELYFTSCLWPDFNEQEAQKAIDAYRSRERRYGGRKNA